VEHRCGQRIELTIPASLEGVGMTRLETHTENVSLSGVLLRMPTSVRIPPLVLVQLKDGNSQRRYRVLAHLTRRMSDRAAFEWARFAPRAIRLLINAERAAPPRCSAPWPVDGLSIHRPFLVSVSAEQACLHL